MAELSFPTKDAEPWMLTDALMASFVETYPTLDVEAEVRKARLWCQVNHAQRKTAKGMPRFLVSWLNRASTERRITPQKQRLDIPMDSDRWARAHDYAKQRQGR